MTQDCTYPNQVSSQVTLVDDNNLSDEEGSLALRIDQDFDDEDTFTEIPLQLSFD
jgi:hypothetical protein